MSAQRAGKRGRPLGLLWPQDLDLFPHLVMNFTTFLNQIANALQKCDGRELAYLLSPRESHGKSVVKDFRNPTVRPLQCVQSSGQATEHYVGGIAPEPVTL